MDSITVSITANSLLSFSETGSMKCCTNQCNLPLKTDLKPPYCESYSICPMPHLSTSSILHIFTKGEIHSENVISFMDPFYWFVYFSCSCRYWLSELHCCHQTCWFCSRVTMLFFVRENLSPFIDYEVLLTGRQIDTLGWWPARPTNLNYLFFWDLLNL